MLRELVIRHFAIIEEVHLQFDHGFHVLTGETGAGKSILIDALGLIIGGRASTDFVRHGEGKAVIEAVFELEQVHPARTPLLEWGFDSEELDQVIVRREISASGKSTCRINGRIVTLALLKKIGPFLIDISGQHEHQSLLHTDEHLEWLDHFGGEDLLGLRKEYERIYETYEEISRQLEQLRKSQRDLARRLDLLKFQANEIESAALVPGEDEKLEQEQKRLSHAEKLMMHGARAYESLNGEQGGLTLIQEAISHLEQIAEVDESLQNILELAQTAYYQLEEASHEIACYRDDFEFDPERLYEVEERLHLIRQLKRKYGDNIEEILAYGNQVEKELDVLENHEETEAKLEQKIGQLREQLEQLAHELTRKRKKAANQLEAKVKIELNDLNMGSTVFKVAFFHDSSRKQRFYSHGQDKIEFQIAPNPGEPLKPLARIASGGELSRLMLALKCIFAEVDQVHTMIFDEIDTGVSGRTAQAIAEKIAYLSRKYQVLCVTHLPQVACMADCHLYISKEVLQARTRTRVEKLDMEGRILELARMLGGVEVTDTTRNHAREMLRLATEAKKNRAG
ncbi:DNA repair protein RecN [Thermoactinomyces mirandus]|uniref:DNA repair protein RecN n=1 Tax=Thermoactinomyces mirandus TaxID=2756294 RepID=A0A7W2AQV8_9BACL|nr:DNA repair protein RecN [Thermoactinomyces mirandus]MBA4600920.1 DNA repair protein RecN [Thermoactinomyces mirandus]